MLEVLPTGLRQFVVCSPASARVALAVLCLTSIIGTVSVSAHAQQAATGAEVTVEAPDAGDPSPTGQAAPSASPPAPEDTSDAASAPPQPSKDAWKPWPAKAILLPLEVSNVDPEWVSAFETLFREEFEEAHGGRTMPPDEAQRAISQLGSPADVMAASGATVYVSGSLTRLDSRIVISVATFDKNGRRIRREKMTAASMDDVEPVSERLGQALGKDISADEARTLDNITVREAQVPTRVKADDLVGFRGGISVPVSDVALNMLITPALDVRFQSERHFVGFAIALVLPANGPEDKGSYGGLSGEVNAAYYLSHTTTAPYVGGGLTARILTGGANLAPSAMLGMMFNRQSGAQAYIELRATQNITPIEVERTLIDDLSGSETVSERVYPFEPSLSAGVGW